MLIRVVLVVLVPFVVVIVLIAEFILADELMAYTGVVVLWIDNTVESM